MAIDLDDALRRMACLEAAAGDIGELPWAELPVATTCDLLARLERVIAALPSSGYSAIERLVQARVPAGGGRLRDYLAEELHISAAEAGRRVATAVALAGPLPETAAAAREGLIGTEHVRIIRDALSMLPPDAGPAERSRLDCELAAVAVAERPEVLRRESARLLADIDARHRDPIARDRARAARRGVIVGPQDPDGMSRGRFCLDPEARAYLEAVLAKLARPGMCNASDPLPRVDGEPEASAAAADERSIAQRNHDAVKAALRAVLASGDLGRHRGLPVTAVITMTLEQLESSAGVAITGGGSTVPAEVAIRMAAHAHHYLYIYDEHCGRPLFLGRSQRLASADQRIVLHAIDGGCTAPRCDRGAYECEVHHLIEWSQGGTTDIDRLALLCKLNHRDAGPSEDRWQARRRYDAESLGQTLWYPPSEVDPRRRPRANRHHRRPKPPDTAPDAA